MIHASRILIAQTMNLSKDVFLHFTSPEQAQQILQDGKLQYNKSGSNGRPGANGVFAVSATWGNYVPSVQIHGANWVAVKFTTNLAPDYGYAEEVIWHCDVPLLTAKIISLSSAIGELESHKPLEDDVCVRYA